MKKVILLCCILCSLYIHAQEQLRWKNVEVPQYEIVDNNFLHFLDSCYNKYSKMPWWDKVYSLEGYIYKSTEDGTGCTPVNDDLLYFYIESVEPEEDYADFTPEGVVLYREKMLFLDEEEINLSCAFRSLDTIISIPIAWNVEKFDTITGYPFPIEDGGISRLFGTYVFKTPKGIDTTKVHISSTLSSNQSWTQRDCEWFKDKNMTPSKDWISYEALELSLASNNEKSLIEWLVALEENYTLSDEEKLYCFLSLVYPELAADQLSLYIDVNFESAEKNVLKLFSTTKERLYYVFLCEVSNLMK
jgi:hypothetical protein